jgi:hypothetical protein
MSGRLTAVSSLLGFYQKVSTTDSVVIQRNVSRLNQEDRRILNTALRVMSKNAANAEFLPEKLTSIVAHLNNPKEFGIVEKICNFFNYIRLGLGIFSKNYLQSAVLASDIEAFKNRGQLVALREKYSDKTDLALKAIQQDLTSLRSLATSAESAAFKEICVHESEMIYDTDSSGTQLPTGNYTNAVYQQDKPDRYIEQMRLCVDRIRKQMEKPGITEDERQALEAICQKYEQFAVHSDLPTQKRTPEFNALYQAVRDTQVSRMIGQHIQERMKPGISIAVIEARLPSLQGAAKTQAELDLELLKLLPNL